MPGVTNGGDNVVAGPTIDELESAVSGQPNDTEEWTSSHKYRMRISRLTLDQLGIRMYDRVAAVLAELVANAYDAEAERVRITLPFDTLLASKGAAGTVDHGFRITVEDDGIGMTAEQVNALYLEVGGNRRSTRGERTDLKRRLVMGRKGIGKLAPFGICRELEVITAGGVADGAGTFAVSHLLLRYDDVVKPEDFDYHPLVGELDGSRTTARGTKIVLRMFARKRVPTADSLHRQLAARFGVRQADWHVELLDALSMSEGQEPNPMTVGDLPISAMEGTQLDVGSRPVPYEGTDLPVTGWVAYAAESYRDDAMAGIRLFARGKIVAQTRDFDIPSGFTGEFKMRSYLVGEIHADWLDEDEDLVRSDRQDIIWNSEKGEALRAWGQAVIRDLAARAETSVGEQTWSDFVVRADFEGRLREAAPTDRLMRDAIRMVARLFVNRADRDQVRDPDYQQRLMDLAFAIGPHRSLVDALQQAALATTSTLDMVLDLFRRASVAEIYSLGQVARERIDTLNTLAKLVGTEETLERQLQALIEQAPWILHPDWTPLSRNARLANVRLAFESWYSKRYPGRVLVTSAIEHPGTAPDFIMVSDQGILEIVEIKRPNHALTDAEIERAYRYLEDLRTFLNENPTLATEFKPPVLVLVCDRLALQNPLAKGVLHDDAVEHRPWETLLVGTRRAHEDFLAAVPDQALLAATTSRALVDSS